MIYGDMIEATPSFTKNRQESLETRWSPNCIKCNNTSIIPKIHHIYAFDWTEFHSLSLMLPPLPAPYLHHLSLIAPLLNLAMPSLVPPLDSTQENAPHQHHQAENARRKESECRHVAFWLFPTAEKLGCFVFMPGRNADDDAINDSREAPWTPIPRSSPPLPLA